MSGGAAHTFRYLVDTQPAEGAEVVLAPDDARHLTRVVRRQAGDPVEVIGPDGALWPCVVAQVDGQVVLRVAGPARPAPPAAPLDLWVGLADAGRLDMVAEKAAELGVARLGVVVTSRARKVPDAHQWQRREERMQRVAVAAAKQSGRGVRPAPMGLVPFAHVLETTTPGQGIILDPRAGDPLAGVLGGHGTAGPVTLLVGGDTGFSDDEVRQAQAAGFRAARMGAGMLRAETAAIAAATLALNAMGALS